jgi:sugar lactone lactonase YvrE
VVINLRHDVLDPGVHLPKRNANTVLIVVGVIVILGVIGGLLATAGGIAAALFGVRQVQTIVEAVETNQSPLPSPDANTPAPTPTLLSSPTPLPFASQALQFGEQGSGPGQFDDPRELAIDLDGNLYVADYFTGRVQKFYPDGKFTWLLKVPPKQGQPAIISDLAVDTDGMLYVVASGDILIYNRSDGSEAGRIPARFPETIFRYVAIDAADNLYAVHDGAAGSDLLGLDEVGQTTFRIESPVFKITNTGTSIEALAVDGLGNSYLLERNASQVFKFDFQGQFVDRIGLGGKEAGQLDSPLGVAVDGQGRLYVVDSNAVSIFTKDGAYLNSISRRGQGAAFDIAVDNHGGVYLVSNLNQVVKFVIPEFAP